LHHIWALSLHKAQRQDPPEAILADGTLNALIPVFPGFSTHDTNFRETSMSIARLSSLRALRVFTVAGRHLSFKLAAEELHLSASAVSHQVRNLEEFLGIDLFVRKTRALEFTGAGAKYFAFLDSMFSRLESETHQLFIEYGRSLIRFCTPPFFASELLLPRLGSFQALMPDTDIRLTTQPSLMQSHPAEADLSILLGTGDWPDLVCYRLFARRLIVGCAPSVAKEVDSSSLASLDGKTLIVHENRPNAWDNWAGALGVAPPQAGKIIRFDSMSSVVQAAVQGLGVAIVSWPLSRNHFESGALVRAFPQEVVTNEHFYLAHRPGEHERLDIMQFIDWVLEEFRMDEKS
jgi:LysR family glycine cleavage system transcriptional activator